MTNLKKGILIHDKGSSILSEFFKDLDSYKLILPYKQEFNKEEVKYIKNKIRDFILSKNIIIYGSNRFHFLSYIFFSIIYEDYNPKWYILIDQHPDNYNIYKELSSGNFIKYLKEEFNIKIAYLGILPPENKKDFDIIFYLYKKENLIKAKDFLAKNSFNSYISIDLDILKYKYSQNFYSKSACKLCNNNLNNLLLDLEDLLNILKYIKKPSFIDICGFLYTKKIKIKKIIETYKKILQIF